MGHPPRGLVGRSVFTRAQDNAQSNARASPQRGWSHSRSLDHRRRFAWFLTAIAKAFLCPTNTTSFLPRVTPV
jgi:hypothetical protein